MRVRIEECYDMDYVEEVLCDGEMWKRIAEDDQDIEDFTTEAINDNWRFLELLTPDGSIGMFILHPVNVTTCKIHAHVLKKFREKYAVEAGWAMMWWMNNHLPVRVRKIIAEIPTVHQDVYHYTKKFGFIDEGVNRKSILIDGEVVDQYYLGITREEIELCLQSRT